MAAWLLGGLGCEGDAGDGSDDDGDLSSDADADSDGDSDGDSDTDSASDGITCKSVACEARQGTCLEELDCGTGCPDGMYDIGPTPPCNYCPEGYKCCATPVGAGCGFIGGECVTGAECPTGTAPADAVCERAQDICCTPVCG